MPAKRGVAANRQAPVASRGKPTPAASTGGRGVGKRPTGPVSLRGTTGRGGAARVVAGTQPKGAPATQKVQAVDEQQTKQKQLTQQDIMAIRIQSFVRAFLSRYYVTTIRLIGTNLQELTCPNSPSTLRFFRLIGTSILLPMCLN